MDNVGLLPRIRRAGLASHTSVAPAVGAIFLFFAIGIAGGAFIGRYHYAVDVLLGAGLAVISFVTVLFFSGSIAG